MGFRSTELMLERGRKIAAMVRASKSPTAGIDIGCGCEACIKEALTKAYRRGIKRGRELQSKEHAAQSRVHKTRSPREV